jgi:hypothetical protein
MPEKDTIERAKEDKRRGKAPTTQAGEFIREELHHIREGKHGARSTKQAIAVGLSKARRAGVKLLPPGARQASPKTRAGAQHAYAEGQTHSSRAKPSRRRSKATRSALKREGRSAASRKSLAEQAHASAAKRSRAQRSAAARKAARTRARKRS